MTETPHHPELSHEDALNLFTRISAMTPFEPCGVKIMHGLGVSYASKRPCVYAWVEERRDGARIIVYIGKAGDGLKKRLGQHRNGLSGGSKTGLAHVPALKEILANGSSLAIYVLHPEPFKFEGYEVPSHSSVEDFFIKAVKPTPARNSQSRVGRKPAAAVMELLD